MIPIKKEIQARLFELQDLKYRDFQCKLLPTVDPASVIGVRRPELRKLAKKYESILAKREFLKILPHKYYEENNLHGFLLATVKNYDDAVKEVERFLPYVNNWAVCDMIFPKIFGAHLLELFDKIKEWVKKNDTYTVRFAVGMLMRLYLDDAFKPEYPELVAGIRSDEYYINMIVAWYFATALAKQYRKILPFLQEKRLDKWTHNKAIQKAVESYRITEEQKVYLKTLKIK
ncbi:MAG: DNA alkylation repair protein [Lachnospiraceae bacterium]|nr:DNA alkylation repair protein [Lachnospiraceae bacterium]